MAAQDFSDIRGKKVMVIDDSNTIRRSAEIFLSQAGCQVILAQDGFPQDAGGDAVVQGRPVRSGAGSHGGLERVSDQAVHERQPAVGRETAFNELIHGP
jgi:CheY-like chemotaxis protein